MLSTSFLKMFSGQLEAKVYVILGCSYPKTARWKNILFQKMFKFFSSPGPRLMYRKQMPGEHCALTAQKYRL